MVLFVVMFLWTPPHFWALAIRYADDYRAANVPMLPAVATAARGGPPDDRLHRGAGRLTTLVLAPVADLGWIYTATAVVLGALFLGGTVGLGRRPDAGALACACSRYSITYVTLLFAAMTVDVLVLS